MGSLFEFADYKIDFAESCDWLAKNKNNRIFRARYSNAVDVIKPFFKYSKKIKIYESDFNKGVFNLNENKDLFSPSVKPEMRRLEILLNENVKEDICDFFKNEREHFVHGIDLRLTKNKLYSPVIIGDNSGFVFYHPELKFFCN